MNLLDRLLADERMEAIKPPEMGHIRGKINRILQQLKRDQRIAEYRSTFEDLLK
jgi:hypothetical protein